MDLAHRISALANANRLTVLRWLADPRAHFPPQVHADIEEVGVCGVFIADKLRVSPATASAHMRLLVDAGFVTARRLGKWTYFKREDAALEAIGRDLTEL
jgi:ArsR family transcriptional regulator